VKQILLYSFSIMHVMNVFRNVQFVAFSSRSTMLFCDCTTPRGAIDKPKNIFKKEINSILWIKLIQLHAIMETVFFSFKIISRVEKVKEFIVLCWTGLVSSFQVQLPLPNSRIAPSLISFQNCYIYIYINMA